MGGREISLDDLLQGFPPDKMDLAKKAVESLEKGLVLRKKPKPDVMIIQAVPGFFSNPTKIQFIEMITSDQNLRKSLVEETLELTIVSETLQQTTEKILRSKQNIIAAKITASEKIAFDGDRGVKVYLKAKCYNDGCFEYTFDLTQIHELSKRIFPNIRCSCGSTHRCTASGQVIRPNSELTTSKISCPKK